MTRLVVAWLILFCSVLVADAEAAWGRVLTPASGARVVAGGLTHVRWTALPPGTEEFELLLSVDGGRSYSLRLTPQLDPTLGVYAWHVPNLPVPHARLRLRVGVGEDELECPPSEPFTIVPIETQPNALLEHRAGEWWPAPPSRHVTTTVAVPSPRLERSENRHRVRTHAGIAPRSSLPAASIHTPSIEAVAIPTAPTVERSAVDRGPASFPLRP